MLNLLIIWIVLAPFALIRGLRWLAIVQQKEYRWDRLRAFLKSEEGKHDVARIWPTRSDLTRQGLKRPVMTARLIIVKLISIKLCSLVFGTYAMPFLIQVSVSLGVYLLLPAIIMVAIIPSALVSMLITYITLIQARQKLKAGKPIIIGITGSYGKTSTKLLIAHVLARKYSVFYTPRSFNTRYSVARSIVKEYRNQDIALLEYGAYTPGEIKFLAQWFPPTKAVVTGLAPQHLELFGSTEKIIAAKSELPLAVPMDEKVFCNTADQGAAQICAHAHQAVVIPYSGEESAVKLNNVGLTANAQLSFAWKGNSIVTQLIGLHYLANVQAAIAVAEHMAVPAAEIVTALESFVPSSLFIQLNRSSSGLTVIDDGGTTNPAGFKAALTVLDWYKSQLPTQKRILVTAGIVDLGTMSDKIHLELADQASSIVDEVWYLGTAGQSSFKKVFGDRLMSDRSQIKQLLTSTTPKDVILVEGKVPKWIYHAINL